MDQQRKTRADTDWKFFSEPTLPNLQCIEVN